MNRPSESTVLCTPEQASRRSLSPIRHWTFRTATGVFLLIAAGGTVGMLTEPDDPTIEQTSDAEGEDLSHLEADSPMIGRWIRTHVTCNEKEQTVHYRFMKEGGTYHIELRTDDGNSECFSLDPQTTEGRNASLVTHIHGDARGIHLYSHKVAAGFIPPHDIQKLVLKLVQEKGQKFEHEIGYKVTRLGLPFREPDSRTGVISIVRQPKREILVAND